MNIIEKYFSSFKKIVSKKIEKEQEVDAAFPQQKKINSKTAIGTLKNKRLG